MPSPVPFNGFSASLSGQFDNTEEIFTPNVTLPGNCLNLVMQTDTSLSGDPTITDDGGNDWGVAFSRLIGGNQMLFALIAPQKIGGGPTVPAQHLSLKFNGADTPSFVQFEFFEVPGIQQGSAASVIDTSGGSVARDAASPVATSSFTPAAGSLIIQYGTGTGAGGPITKFTKGSGWTLFATQTFQITGGAFGGDLMSMLQYKVASGSSETPTYSYTGTSDDSDSIAYALKADASKGTAPPAGLRVHRVQHRAVPPGTSDETFQFPHFGNLIHVSAQHDHVINSITDSDSNTYSGSNNLSSGLSVNNSSWSAVNVAPNSDLSDLKITWSASMPVNVGFVTLYDFVGADANPFVQTVVGEGFQTTGVDLDTTTKTSGVGTITPQFANGVIVINGMIDSHTYVKLVTPSVANGGRTSSAVCPAMDGGGTTLEDDDIHSHWYNGASLAAQNFVFNMQHNTNGVQHWAFFATEYKAPAGAAASGPLPKQLYVMP